MICVNSSTCTTQFQFLFVLLKSFTNLFVTLIKFHNLHFQIRRSHSQWSSSSSSVVPSSFSSWKPFSPKASSINNWFCQKTDFLGHRYFCQKNLCYFGFKHQSIIYFEIYFEINIRECWDIFWNQYQGMLRRSPTLLRDLNLGLSVSPLPHGALTSFHCHHYWIFLHFFVDEPLLHGTVTFFHYHHYNQSTILCREQRWVWLWAFSWLKWVKGVLARQMPRHWGSTGLKRWTL